MNTKLLRQTGPVLLLVVAVAALYGQFLWNPLVFDDLYVFLLDNDDQQPVSSMRFAWLELRSLPYATLAWTKALFGLDLIYFRIGNLLLHAAVSVALYGFLKSFFASIPGQSAEQNSVGEQLSPQAMALMAALLFAVHPVSTYAAGYLVQRSILLATLFSLLAMWTWVNGCTRNQQAWLWCSVPMYYLAVFSKEHAIMMIAVLPLLTVVLNADWQVKWKQHAGIFAAMAGIALLAVLARKNILGSVYFVVDSEELSSINTQLPYVISVLTQAALFFKYGILWLLPNPNWMAMDMPQPYATISPLYLLACAAFLGWGAAGFWWVFKRGSKALLGFAMLFPWLLFMSEFSTVRVHEVFVLYRSYLWSVGALCAVPVLLRPLPPRLVMLGAAVCTLAFFPISMERLVTLSHPVLLWDDAAKYVDGRTELPGVSRIYYNRGTEYVKADMPDKAIPDLHTAIALAPHFPEAYGNLGGAYFKKGDWVKAVAAFSQAIDVSLRKGKIPGARYYLLRAQSFENLGDTQRAQKDYRESCRLARQGCEQVR